MKSRLSNTLSAILILIVFGISSCQKNNFDDVNPTEKHQFHLTLSDDNEYRDAAKTRSIDNQTVKYFVSDKQGNVINDLFGTYNAELQTITIEPLIPGDYELFILAYTPSLEEKGFTVATNLTHKSEAWIHFSQDAIGLLDDSSILFGECTFTVGNTTSLDIDVALSNVLTSVTFNTKFPNEYIKDITSEIAVSLEPIFVNRSLSVDGALSGSVPLVVEDVAIKSNHTLYTLPSLTNEQTTFTINTETVNHERIKFKSIFEKTSNSALKRGVQSTINIDMSNHPDANTGVLYVNRKKHDLKIRPKILQDSESKLVYYHSSKRSFYIHKPLEVKISEDNKIHTRFYSPITVKNVEIWAKFTDVKEEVLIAFFDSIPAFTDAEFDILLDDKCIFKTKNNDYIYLKQSNIDNLHNADLSIESDDIYLQKIKTIRCDWWQKFTSFGGNPDLDTGGPAGNWKGIRPVHIREAIALLTNMAYMFSSKEFNDYLSGFQGQLYNNNKKVIDLSTLSQAFLNHSGYDLGLVYEGNGVLGMGGGRSMGYAQYVYLQHYTNYYACNTIFHELSHTIGYSHSSNMTYGIWANGVANTYYVDNVSTFPVNSQSHLNSMSNPTLYQ